MARAPWTGSALVCAGPPSPGPPRISSCVPSPGAPLVGWRRCLKAVPPSPKVHVWAPCGDIVKPSSRLGSHKLTLEKQNGASWVVHGLEPPPRFTRSPKRKKLENFFPAVDRPYTRVTWEEQKIMKLNILNTNLGRSQIDQNQFCAKVELAKVGLCNSHSAMQLCLSP